MDDLVLGFPQTCKRCNMRDIFFFSAGHFLRHVFSCKIFFSIEISLQDIFFLKSPIPPSKVKWSGKVSQLFLSPILDLLAVTILPLEI